MTWKATVNSYIYCPPLVVLILMELERHGFKIEYEFSAIVTLDNGANIEWDSSHLREVRVYGKPNSEILTFLGWGNFRNIPGGWCWKNSHKKLELVKESV